MVRNNFKRLPAVLLICMLFACTCGVAFAGGDAKGYSSADLKKMSTFLSNFTELRFMNFETKDLTDENDPAEMIRFGIWHNYVNNFKSRIAQCPKKDCEWGALVLEGKYVTETIKKFFDVDYTKLASVTEADMPFFYDGKLYHFDGADGEAVYFARVDEAVKNSEGKIVMRGEVYNAEEETEILGTFEAVTKPHKFGGKDTWAILSMATEFHDLAEETSDEAVAGLWIEVPGFPAEGSVVDFQMNDEGVASYTRTLDDGALALVVERLPAADDSGEPTTPDDIGAFVAAFEGIEEGAIQVTPSLDEIAKLYSYPVAGAEFTTGENEDSRQNIDLFIFTDPWLFRIHVSMMADSAEKYEEQIKEWFTHLKFRE